MLPFAYYLLKVTLVSGLLYSYYFIALRNKKFHQYNRFYLLLSVLLSLIMPLISIKLPKFGNQEPHVVKLLSVLNNASVYVKTATTKQQMLSYYNQVALYVFLAITAFAFCILIFQVLRIFFIIRSSRKKKWNNICFVFTKNQGTPFSFFRYIFWDENINMESDEGNHILQHELTHVEQNHSADKLFLNVVLTACWANPFFWIIRNDLTMLHEFIADQKSISNGDTNAFATMLLTATYPQHSFALTHSFFHSPIKRRLLMITTSKTTSYGYFRRLMILPLLALISILSAFTMEGKNIEEVQTFQRNGGRLIQKENPGVTKEYLNKEEYSERNNSASVNASDTIEAKFPGGDQAWKRYLEKNLDANVPVVKDRAPAGVYTVKVQFIVLENGDIKDVSAIQSPAGCPSCAKEAVSLIKKGPKWDPMTIDGENVTSQQVQFISFMVEK